MSARRIRDARIPLEEITGRSPGVFAVLDLCTREVRRHGTRLIAPERYARRYRVTGWNGTVDACMVPCVLRAEVYGQAWTRDEHDTAAEAWIRIAGDLARMWREVLAIALRDHGEGDGVLISGVYRDHFPREVKDTLRDLARAETFAWDASLAHWIGGSGRRAETWRRMRDALHAEGRSC